MPGFRKKYGIHSFQIDSNREAAPVSILQIFEDTAVSHAAHAGLGMDHLLAESTGWVLNRWLFQMERYPVLGEEVTVETWPSRFDRFYATREFRIADADGKLLGRASSLWIYLDAVKKRPLRIPADFARIYELDEARETADSFPDIPAAGADAPAVLFHVRRRDIDTNGHVNNSRYIDWMLEGTPDDLAGEYQLSRLEVVYRKETGYGADIRSECETQSGEYPVCLHRIREHPGGQTLALGKTVWRKRG